MKLAILGGGGFRTPFVWEALLRDHGEPRITEVALYDIDQSRLLVIEAILRELAEGFEDVPKLTVSTKLEPVIEGADFIFAAIREGGLDGRCCDEHVALDLNVLGQETTGPGGIAYAIRTVPVMVHIAEKVKRCRLFSVIVWSVSAIRRLVLVVVWPVFWALIIGALRWITLA